MVSWRRPSLTGAWNGVASLFCFQIRRSLPGSTVLNSAADVSGRFYWIYSFCNVSLDTVGVEHRHIKTFASVLQGVSAQYYLRKHPSHSPFWPTPLSRNKGPRYCSTHRAAAGGPS
ncbi:hypothetical protein, unlikely [Trypanosoma brucei gambiense DAL972]|uniref:Uncharacterized protein n=1 Tax=Trypanosoma brucei gambiense (strain MHOM/CI/86/DAL972) TaxID=679716 RepID=C9ZXE2_TRYB9|nr:hypothetical protein, unlikely [Trypanosoma brucei gambiense DAL972]CBH14086.1 hypothetical protein, unlikely [Trypanosoma brucei gambiense DAL972]|eukprot:XP_011776357.1 hypothetical protein, unlikely [Trypanosoma brucei gambiense DAL972]